MKLTNDLRDRIVMNVVHAKYTKMLKEAYDVIVKAIEEETKEQLAAQIAFLNYIEQAYTEFKAHLRTSDRVYFINEIGSTVYDLLTTRRRDIPESFHDIWLMFRDYVKLSFDILDTETTYNYIILTDEIRSLLHDYDILLGKALEDYNTVKSIVYSCTTDTKLLELVPEIASYIPYPNVSTAIVPVETVNAVRNILRS